MVEIGMGHSEVIVSLLEVDRLLDDNGLTVFVEVRVYLLNVFLSILVLFLLRSRLFFAGLFLGRLFFRFFVALFAFLFKFRWRVSRLR